MQRILQIDPAHAPKVVAATLAAAKAKLGMVIDSGIVSNADIADVKAAGFSGEEALEILGNVAVNLLANYFNHLAATDIDFPRVSATAAGH